MPKDLVPRLALGIFSSHRTASLASLEFFLCRQDLAFLVLSRFFDVIIFDFTCLLGADDAFFGFTFLLGVDDTFFGFAFLLGVDDLLAGASCTVHDCFFPIKHSNSFLAQDN